MRERKREKPPLPPNLITVNTGMAGKGRTGTVIASYLLYSGLFTTAGEALNYFACKRSLTINGVTVPSQRRYVNYVRSITMQQFRPSGAALVVKTISLSRTPRFSLGMGNGNGLVPVLSVFTLSPRKEQVFSSTWCGPAPVALEGDSKITFGINKVIRGDVYITVEHAPPFSKATQVLRFNFHTGFVSPPALTLTKAELDDADVDSRFPNDFAVEIDVEVASQLNAVEREKFARELEAEEILYEATLRRPEPTDGRLCWFDPAIDGSLAASIEAKITQARNECGTQLQGSYIEKSGWLTKRGHKVRNWKQRWFVLKEGTLSYFKSPKDTVPCGTILLDDICAVVPNSPPADSSHIHCFEIVVSPREYSPSVSFRKQALTYLICSIEGGIKDEWVEAIELARMERKVPNSTAMDKRGSRVASPLV